MELINKAMLSLTTTVILIKIATTKIATEILFCCISLNSFTPLVSIENNKNTAPLIPTAAIKPIKRYSPEYFTIDNESTGLVCVVESRITLVIEGKISLNMMPMDNTIPEVKIVKARLCPERSSAVKKSLFRIL